MKAYLALNNKVMEKFLINCKLFEITNNLENYDIMFCDTIKLGKNIKSSVKIYLACHYFEHLQDLSVYEDYDYFIGFGHNSIYETLYESVDLECSKILNGFISLNNEPQHSPSDDIIVSCLEENYNDQSKMFEISQELSRTFFRILSESNFDLYFNHPLPNPIPQNKKNKYHWTDDISLELLKDCNFFFTDSLLNCRLYFHKDIIKKTILPCTGYFKTKKTVEEINKLAEPERSILNRINLKNLSQLHQYVYMYRKIFGEVPFNGYAIGNHIQRMNRENKQNNSNKFMIYNHNIDMTQRVKKFPLYINDPISIYKFMINFDKVSNKENKHVAIPNVSDEFIDVLKRIIK